MVKVTPADIPGLRRPRTSTGGTGSPLSGARWRVEAIGGETSYGDLMHVELLYWDGCPSYPRALADLRDAMAEIDLELSEIDIREITSEAEARLERFVGSPTVRIDGVDVVPTTSEAYGLTCRVYHRRDGHISPTPDPSDLLAALRAALEHA